MTCELAKDRYSPIAVRTLLSLGLAYGTAGCAAFLPPAPVDANTEVESGPAVSVLVYDVEDAATLLNDTERTQLSDFFRGQVDLQPTFQVVANERVRAELQARKRDSYAATQDQATQIEIGKAVSATQLVRPQLLKVGEQCTWTVTVYDLTTEARVRTESVDGDCGSAHSQPKLTQLARALGRPPGTPDVEGLWKMDVTTTTGVLNFEIDFLLRGEKLIGTYDTDARYEGRLAKGVFEGTWTRDGFSGRVRLIFSQDGQTFTGVWGLGQSNPDQTIVGRRP